jgi:glucose-1-phosphate adenylyltransferase
MAAEAVMDDFCKQVASVVLAGGQGTRLFPLTQARSKPAVVFGGRYRLIDIPLSNSLNSKIDQIFVISQYFATELQNHISASFQFDNFRTGKIEMLCPEETAEGKIWFKGTADAVRQNMKHLLKSSAQYFLILSGDQLYNIDFRQMLTFAIKSGADFVVAALPVKEPEAKRMGLLQVDHAGRILDFDEKPQDPAVLKKHQITPRFYTENNFSSAGGPHFLGSMGIYIFKREALMEAMGGDEEDFGRHVIPKLVKRQKGYGFLHHGYWEDIGTVASYYEANMALASHTSCLNTYDEYNPIFTCPHHLPSPFIKETAIKDSLISQGALIEAKEITRSIIGVRAQIKRGSVIRDSIIVGHHTPLPSPFTIGEDCLIEKAIVDENTQIGNRVHLVNKKKLTTYDGDGVYIRDGIIIVTKGTQLPDGFVL